GRAVHTRFTATTDKAPRQRAAPRRGVAAAVLGYALHRCRNASTLIQIDALLSSCLTRGNRGGNTLMTLRRRDEFQAAVLVLMCVIHGHRFN
ncbi:hypothetical protein, partial [Burkholderia pyrrocinia]|uniref:hypothetical protein n=1 Tax=Burkholderia pyrrocinia TaxID=60550 RepID=UPI001ABA3B93